MINDDYDYNENENNMNMNKIKVEELIEISMKKLK